MDTDADVVFLDLDETLLSGRDAENAAFRVACGPAHAGPGINADDLRESVRRHARELWLTSATRPYCVSIGISASECLWPDFAGDDVGLDALRDWAPTYRRLAWCRALAEFGVDDPPLATRLADAFRQERGKRHPAFPEVESALQHFKGQYRLAVITNGASSVQRDKLSKSRLEPYFEAVFVSGELGVGKPDPRIFTIALRELDILPERAVMVGDSLESDVGGSQRSGIKGVWVNRSGRDGDPAIKPDAEIASLAELPGILGRIGQGNA
jgi:putative hydrolase of the HAD superfamily